MSHANLQPTFGFKPGAQIGRAPIFRATQAQWHMVGEQDKQEGAGPNPIIYLAHRDCHHDSPFLLSAEYGGYNDWSLSLPLNTEHLSFPFQSSTELIA